MTDRTLNVVLLLLSILFFLITILLPLAQTGGSQLWVLITIALFLLIQILIQLYVVQSAQNRLLREIDSRLPAVEILIGFESIGRALLNSARDAKKFLFVTGSASRDETYLDAIDAAVSRGVNHSRILYHRHVHPLLQNHLMKLITAQQISLCYLNEDHFGYFSLTEQQAIIFFPAVPGEAPRAVSFRDASQIEEFRAVYERMLAAATPLNAVDQLKKLIEHLSAVAK